VARTPHGALQVGGSFEFAIGDFDRAVEQARENCAWRASVLPAAERPDDAPVIVNPLMQYFPGEIQYRDRDAVVGLFAAIDSTGRVTRVWPFLSLPQFDRLAERELRKTVIRPAERARVPIESRVYVPFRFVR
jgi:hypothetical protein